MSVYGVIFDLHFFGIFPHSDWLRISSYSTRMWINADQHNSEHGHFLRIAYIIHLNNIQVVAWNYKSVIQGGFIWQEVSGTSINLFEVRCNGHLMNYFSLMRHCGINTNLHAFFYKQHFDAMSGWNWQKIQQMQSNTLRLNFCYLKIIHILHPPCYSKIIGHILKNKPKGKCACIHEIIRNLYSFIWQGDWALGYHSMKFRHFLDIS